MTTAEFRVEEAGSYAQIVRDKPPFATIEGDTVIVRSRLEADESLGTPMVWLCGQFGQLDARASRAPHGRCRRRPPCF